MKHLSIIFSCAASIVLAASCQKEISDNNMPAPSEEIQKNGLLKVVFKAGTPETKADFESSRITWKDNDSLAVWDGVQVRKFTLMKDTENTFQGEVDPEAEIFDLVYPFTAMSEEGVINVTPSANQIIPSGKAADPASLICSKTGVTDLVAGVTFDNVVSLLKFNIDIDGVSKISVLGNEQLNDADILTITPRSESFAQGTYYAAVKPATLSKITILFNVGESTKVVEKTAAINFVAGSGVNINNFASSANAVQIAPIASASDLNNFSKYAALFGPDAVVNVTASVVAGSNFESIKNFAGTLNGNSNKISGLSAPLFDTLSGSVKNLDVQADITVSDPATEYAGILARVTQNSTEGTKIENIHTSGSININIDGTLDHLLYIGGVCGCNKGTAFENLGNSADITVSKVILDISGGTSGTNANHLAIGGIAGSLADRTSGSEKIILAGCTNSGAITYANTSSFSGTNIYSCVGGIFGSFLKNHYVINGMTNSGAISVTNAVNYTKGNFYVGGILGWSNQGVAMSECVNSADISYTPRAAVIASRVGGIVGVSNAAAITFTDCSNSGNITIATPLEYAGGVLAYTTAACSLTGCTNSGDLNINAGVKYSGGICGYTTKATTFDSCTNTGSLLYAKNSTTISAKDDTYNVGGILGACVNETAAGSTFNNCTNGVEGDQTKGRIWLNVEAKYYYVGGIVGNITDKPSSAPQIAVCTNYAEIRNTGKGSGTSYIGGLIGFCRVQAAFVIGDKEGNSFCYNYGDIINDPSASQSGSIWLGGVMGCHNKSTSSNNKAVEFYYTKNYGNIKNENSNSAGASKMRFGGILGTDSSTTSNKISYCENYGSIIESVKGGQDIATILGYSTSCTISNCGIGGYVNTTAVTADNFADFVQGTASGASTATVKDCYFVSL